MVISKRGELLLAVPLHLAVGPPLELTRCGIAAGKKVDELFEAFRSANFGGASPFIQTVLALLHEQSLGLKKSDWGDYIEYLERVHIDTPASWNPAEKQGLQIKNDVRLAMQGPRASISMKFKENILPFFRS